MNNERYYPGAKSKMPARPGGETKKKELTPEQIFELNELYWDKNMSRFDSRSIAQVGECVMDRNLMRWADWVRFKNEFLQKKALEE